MRGVWEDSWVLLTDELKADIDNQTKEIEAVKDRQRTSGVTVGEGIEPDYRKWWHYRGPSIPTKKGLRYAAVWESYYFGEWAPMLFGRTDMRALHWVMSSLMSMSSLMKRNIIIQSK